MWTTGKPKPRKSRSALEDWMVLGALCPQAMLRGDHDSVLTECTGSGTSDGLGEARCATSSGALYICVPRSSLTMRGCALCQSPSSPGTTWCSAYARPSPRHASPCSVRRATGAQRLASAGTLVHVLMPPVKAGISQGEARAVCHGFIACHLRRSILCTTLGQHTVCAGITKTCE